MRWLDRPLGTRTFREWILILHLVGSVVVARLGGDHSWNVYAYAAVGLLFATRFFAARVVYLSLAIGALALQLGIWMQPQVTFAHQAPVLLEILGCMWLLCGPDLVRRFDEHGRGLGPIRNFWRDMTVAQRRSVAWGAHLIGATGGVLYHLAWNFECGHAAAPRWVYPAIGACAAVGFLYLWGRAIAAPATVALGAAIAWRLAPDLGVAIDHLRGSPRPVPMVALYAPHYVAVAFVTAAGAALVALPWTARWAGLAIRRPAA
jgi:hypothetical protein